MELLSVYNYATYCIQHSLNTYNLLHSPKDAMEFGIVSIDGIISFRAHFKFYLD